ncbi:MAG: hypothetical protein IPM90_05750 [Austwickia sp.]|nr:hypothetical protein [Austwickia sp.]
MSELTAVARGVGWASVAIGVLQAAGGSRIEAGMGNVDGLLTRAGKGAPHRVHDVLMLTELACPVVVEALARHQAGSGAAAA